MSNRNVMSKMERQQRQLQLIPSLSPDNFVIPRQGSHQNELLHFQNNVGHAVQDIVTFVRFRPSLDLLYNRTNDTALKNAPFPKYTNSPSQWNKRVERVVENSGSLLLIFVLLSRFTYNTIGDYRSYVCLPHNG